MKGYKASINGICRDFKFEVGKTYEIEGELELCKNGFHFCKTIADTGNYYNYHESNIYFEVESVGEVVSEENDKYATNKIKILSIVDPNHDGTLHIKDGKLSIEKMDLLLNSLMELSIGIWMENSIEKMDLLLNTLMELSIGF